MHGNTNSSNVKQGDRHSYEGRPSLELIDAVYFIVVQPAVSGKARGITRSLAHKKAE